MLDPLDEMDRWASTREAELWVNRNGGRFHRGLAPSSNYEEQRASPSQKLPEQESDVVQSHTERFQAALAICHHSPKKSLQDLDIHKAQTWDELTRVYQDAQLKYAEKGKGWLGLPRRLGRSVGDKSRPIFPWLEFIPEGTYTATLKAGLTLIFGAAARLSERRQLILETFGNIPFLIRDTEYSVEDFRHDAILKELIMDLYVSVLQIVMVMMEWLVERGGWKQIKALLQGPGYGTNLDTMTKDIQEKLQSIDKRVNKLSKGTIVSTSATVNSMASQVAANQAHTRTLLNDSTTIKATINETQGSVKQMQESTEKGISHLTNLLTDNVQNSDWINKAWQESKRREQAELAQRELQEQLKAVESKFQAANTKLQSFRQQQGMIVRSKELLRLLDEDPQRVSSDIEEVIRDSQHLDAPTHARGQMLMQHRTFKDWLALAHSKTLLVDGNALSSMERISAMSVVSALLAQNLPNEVASTIAYFCGMHAGEGNIYNGAANLVRSLLAQIIDRYKLDTTFLESSAYNELQNLDIRRLCDLFVEMVKKLPYGVVLFCIIDGITWLEEDECLKEVCYVVEALSSLTRDPEVRAVFKLLFTSPLASHYVKEYVYPDEQLCLLHDVNTSGDLPLSGHHLEEQSAENREDQYEEDMRNRRWNDDFVDDEGVILDDD